MNKITIYTSNKLQRVLEENSKRCGVSLNTYICDILMEALISDPESQVIESEITKDIYEQINDYIKDAKDGDEFCLTEASTIYRDIEYTYKFDAKKLKQKIGMSFAKQVKNSDKFNDVQPAYNDEGKRKLGKNNAVLYRVVRVSLEGDRNEEV